MRRRDIGRGVLEPERLAFGIGSPDEGDAQLDLPRLGLPVLPLDALQGVSPEGEPGSVRKDIDRVDFPLGVFLGTEVGQFHERREFRAHLLDDVPHGVARHLEVACPGDPVLRQRVQRGGGYRLEFRPALEAYLADLFLRWIPARGRPPRRSGTVP